MQHLLRYRQQSLRRNSIRRRRYQLKKSHQPETNSRQQDDGNDDDDDWESAIAHYGLQLWNALEFLHHKQRIIHADIKPANVLLRGGGGTKNGTICLADFGSAVEITNDSRKSNTSDSKDNRWQATAATTAPTNDYIILSKYLNT